MSTTFSFGVRSRFRWRIWNRQVILPGVHGVWSLYSRRRNFTQRSKFQAAIPVQLLGTLLHFLVISFFFSHFSLGRFWVWRPGDRGDLRGILSCRTRYSRISRFLGPTPGNAFTYEPGYLGPRGSDHPGTGVDELGGRRRCLRTFRPGRTTGDARVGP